MRWEHLTSPEFAEAVRETQTCILPMGVIEKHSEHLPLGTDYLVVHHIACLAAEREPAVVFPWWYFGQVYNLRCFPGTVSIRPGLSYEIIHNLVLTASYTYTQVKYKISDTEAERNRVFVQLSYGIPLFE